MLRSLPYHDAPGRGAAAKQEDSCPLGQCDGSGWLLDDGNTARPCACRERRVSRASSRRLGSGIPKRFRGVSFERKPICDLDPFVLRHVREFVRGIDENLDAGRGLWFYGDVGTGKTSLAMLVSNAGLEAGRSAANYSVPRLLAEIKDTYDRDSGDSYLQLFGRLCAVDLLLLDDLGSEKQTEWVLEQLYSIVNERWQEKRSIVVTTNVSDQEPRATLKGLRDEIAELRRLREGGARADQLRDIADRLDWTAGRLEKLESAHGGDDPLTRLRQQIGVRTVSRLIEICGDPIPLFGKDLRVALNP
jgi:DNA replication protein DnaC